VGSGKWVVDREHRAVDCGQGEVGSGQ
jgi:hypothetical protein